MPPRRAPKRKLQTKLTFSPVSASSLAAADLPPSVRSRAAAVAVSASPSRRGKKQKVIHISDDSEAEPALPTPKKSFNLSPFGTSVRDSKRSKKTGMPVLTQRNGMFGSEDLESVGSKDSSSSESEEDRAPVEKKGKASKHSKSSKQNKRKCAASRSSSEDEEEEEEVSRAPAKMPIRTTKRKRAATPSSSSSEEEAVKSPVKKPNRRSGRSQAPAKSSSEDEEAVNSPVKKPTRTSKRNRPTATSSSEVEEAANSADKKPNRTSRRNRATTESSSEEDAIPTSADRRGKSPITRATKKADDTEEESEDEICPPSTRRRLARRRPTKAEDEEEQEQPEDESNEEDDEDADEDDGASAKPRRHAADDSERQELEEDLEFLRSSPPPARDRLRNINSKPLSERQKTLDALKKRRAAASSQGAPSSSATSRLKRVVIDSDSDAELEIIKEEDEEPVEGPDDDSQHGSEEEGEEGEEEEENEGSDAKPKSRGRRTNARDIFQLNDYDEGFIDDDPDADLGEPADLPAIPIEFTALSRAKPKELFKYAIEWMVQKKINPGFSSTDEIYDLAFRKLDDEVKGLANSKYSSAAWTPEFTRAVRVRPEINIIDITRGLREVMDGHCEACNRKSHPATFSISFAGEPYDKKTLEPLGGNSDDSSDSLDSELSASDDDDDYQNGEKKTYDDKGELLPPVSKTFAMGSTCKANAYMAHTLHHWKYHLNTWVVDYLVQQGHCTPEKLVKRDKWSQRKRQKAANKIVDEMEKNGEIRKLHKLYKDQVDYAVETKNEFKMGWGRR